MTTGADHARVDDVRLAGLRPEPVWDLFCALNYLCAAQLYLRDNVLLQRPLAIEHVKPSPAGHWGTCPPVNWALAMSAALAHVAGPALEIEVVHGGGHAGPSALAFAYLTGRLERAYPDLALGAQGVLNLVSRFPHAVLAGGEVTPAIPGVRFMGGELGHAMGFAQGRVLDRPDRTVVALIGDGECETGATAASWLGARAIACGEHGAVLPVVLLNGLRMGGPSLLARMSREERCAYFTGLGYEPITIRPDVDSPSGCFEPRWLAHVFERLRTIGRIGAPVLLLELAKGATGPKTTHDGDVIANTARIHKRPLDHPGDSPEALGHLERWLRSYDPARVLPQGRPDDELACLLASAPLNSCVPVAQSPRFTVDPTVELGDALTTVRSQHDLRVFSPDELWSNGVRLADAHGDGPPWVVEILNEHLCDSWARGYCCDGDRSAVVISYEAFSPLLTGQIAQALKAARVRAPDALPIRAPVHVFTSLGWQNSFSHQDTTLTDWLVGGSIAGTRLHFPLLSPTEALRECLGSDEHHFVWYCKHTHVDEAAWAGLTRTGPAAWVRTGPGEPAVILVAVGNRPGQTALHAQERIDSLSINTAFLALTELQAARHLWPSLLTAAGADPEDPPPILLLGTPGRQALAQYAAELDGPHPIAVRGFDPGAGALDTAALAHHCRMDVDSVVDDAVGLVRGLEVPGPV